MPRRVISPREIIATPFESIPVILSRSQPEHPSGHFTAAKYACRFPNAVYLTWLRDPVERVASNYFYWQHVHRPKDPLWEQVVGQKLDLEQFAQLPFARDLQYKHLAPSRGGAFRSSRYHRGI